MLVSRSQWRRPIRRPAVSSLAGRERSPGLASAGSGFFFEAVR